MKKLLGCKNPVTGGVTTFVREGYEGSRMGKLVKTAKPSTTLDTALMRAMFLKGDPNLVYNDTVIENCDVIVLAHISVRSFVRERLEKSSNIAVICRVAPDIQQTKTIHHDLQWTATI